MCKYYGKEPDDDWFENLAPVKRLWMYYSWCQDQEDRNELFKSFSIFLGSFYNPEAAQKMINKDGSSYSLTDEEFEESYKMVLEDKEKKKQHRRRRRVIS